MRLRARGRPCLSSPRGTLAVAVGVVALATAPAAAAQSEFLKPLGWYGEAAGVPASVQFEDVAATASTVVAVGSDDASGAAVVYRRSVGVWRQDELPLPSGGSLAGSTLVDVALTAGGEGWAVGSRPGAAGAREPLVYSLSGDGWSDRSAELPAGTEPAAVAVQNGSATIGDAAGRLHRISAGGTTTSQAAGAGRINGIALFGAGAGFAVAAQGPLVGVPDTRVRIYELGGVAPVLNPSANAATGGVHMTGLAATSAEQAVAIDSTQTTWRVNRTATGSDWIQESALAASLTADPSQPRRLEGVAAVAGGPAPFGGPGYATEFLAGAVGSAPEQGALWHRTRWNGREQAWAADAVPAGTPPLTGVVAPAWDGAWAVGVDGTVLRYWRPPDPEAEQLAREQAERERAAEAERLEAERERAEEAERERAAEAERQQAEAQRQRAQQAERERAAEDERRLAQQGEQDAQHAERERAVEREPKQSSPAQDGDRFDKGGIVIKDGRKPERPKQGTKRLVKNVRAARRGRRLIVDFSLTRRARVRLAAKRGRKVVAKTRMRTLGKGRGRLVLRFRGRPPSSLKLIARPAPPAQGTGRTGGTNRTRSGRQR